MSKVSNAFTRMPATLCIAAACAAMSLVYFMTPFEMAAYPDCPWWSYLTSIFVHGGVLHLLMNLSVLLWVGVRLESERGPLRTAALFVGGGLLGSLLAVAGGTAVVGASGGIWALVVYCAVMYTNTYGRDSAHAHEMLGMIAANALVSLMPGISFLGHLGGALAGLVSGVLLEGERG